MNLTLLVFLCLLAPINTCDVPAESIATVNLQKCLKFAPTRNEDSGILATDIIAVDRKAMNLVNHKNKMEALSRQENATELDRLNAKLSQLEFDAYRQSAQVRLKTAEEAMFKKWHEQVNAATKLVAQRDNITVVLYVGEDLNDIEVAANGILQMLAQTHVGYLRDEKCLDITDKVIEELTKTSFIESVKTGMNKSE